MSRNFKVLGWSIAIAIGVAIIALVIVNTSSKNSNNSNISSVRCDGSTGKCTGGWNLRGWTENKCVISGTEYMGPSTGTQQEDGKTVCEYGYSENLEIEKQGTWDCPSMTVFCP